MNGQEPVFKRISNTDLFLLDSGEVSSTQYFQFAFLASEKDTAMNLTMEKAWADVKGIYLFLTKIPADAELLIEKVRSFVNSAGFENTRFLWVNDPDCVQPSWISNRLCAEVHTNNGVAKWVVTQTECFLFADYQFSIGASCTIDGPSLENGYGFTITQPQNFSNILFMSPQATFNISSKALIIPLLNMIKGCFLFDLRLNNADENSDFVNLQAFCAYFIPDPADESGNYVKTLKFPVVYQPHGELTLYTHLDPLNPLESSRTLFSFINPNEPSAPQPAMKASFITAAGNSTCLTPLFSGSQSGNAGFVFSKHPLLTDPLVAPSYYLALCGSFAVSAEDISQNGVPVRLVCGISGTEYIMATDSSQLTVSFIPGRSAFVPGQGNREELLTDLGTTSWVTFGSLSNTTVCYYAQPEQALLYDTAASVTPYGSESSQLDFLEVPAAMLSDTDSGAAFPMAPFKGIDPADAELCVKIEYRAISPRRRAIINSASSAAFSPECAEEITGVTPQGLVIQFDKGSAEWKRLVIGKTGAGLPMSGAADRVDIEKDWLELTGIKGGFKAALQSSQMFAVIANPEVFFKSASVCYKLTDDTLHNLLRLKPEERGSDKLLHTIWDSAKTAGYPVFENRESYESQLKVWAPGIAGFLAVWEKEGAFFELSIAGWRFLLSPYLWQNAATQKNTFMLLKYSSLTLDELIDDTGTWQWPEAATLDGELANTQKILRGIFDNAKKKVTESKNAGLASPYQHFTDILSDPNWNGALFLNCDVPLNQLPDELKGIAAGIDSDKFYAHHLGLNITPLSLYQGEIFLGTSSIFGLIDYSDPNDLMYTKDTEFDFKTLSLCILFENSCIKSFSCKIELLICRLFGCAALLNDGVHGNNIILEGTCQTDKGKNFYSFSQLGANRYNLEDSALETVEITSSSFATLAPESEKEKQDGIMHTRFSIGGVLYFTECEKFDAFSFGRAADKKSVNGSLRFSSLCVDMTFDADTQKQKKSFSVRTDVVSFDMSKSVCRKNGIFNKFPLTLTGMTVSPVTETKDDKAIGLAPKEFGYTAVGSPLQQGELAYPWYGLTFDLNLGTLGALASNAGFKLTLLIAWSASEPLSDLNVYIGMKLPNLSSLGIPLEGILDIGFRNIQFLSSETDKGRCYMLRLRQFGIKLLGLSFPPGNNDIYLFGNPDNKSNTKLGWYAAYSDGKDNEGVGTDERHMLSGRLNRREISHGDVGGNCKPVKSTNL